MKKGESTRTVSPRMMRIKQLAETAGVSKATIQFYVKEGLIPKPTKTHTNMAYYDNSHLDAIKIIKELQLKRFLPLSVIKQMVRGRRGGMSVDEIRTLAEIDGKVFQNITENPTVKPVTAHELSERTGVSLKDIKILDRIQFLYPVKKGKKKLYREDDIRMVECWAKLHDAKYFKGLNVEANSLKFLRELLELVVVEESKLFAGSIDKNISTDRLAKMVEEATPVLNNMIGLLHKQLIEETVNQFSKELEKE